MAKKDLTFTDLKLKLIVYSKHSGKQGTLVGISFFIYSEPQANVYFAGDTGLIWCPVSDLLIEDFTAMPSTSNTITD